MEQLDHPCPFLGCRAGWEFDGHLVAQISTMPEFSACDLRVVPASPGKAQRLNCFLHSGNAAFYVNRIEAEIICDARFSSSIDAANALIELGAARAIVTDGPDPVADALQNAKRSLHQSRR